MSLEMSSVHDILPKMPILNSVKYLFEAALNTYVEELVLFP